MCKPNSFRHIDASLSLSLYFSVTEFVMTVFCALHQMYHVVSWWHTNLIMFQTLNEIYLIITLIIIGKKNIYSLVCRYSYNG